MRWNSAVFQTDLPRLPVFKHKARTDLPVQGWSLRRRLTHLQGSGSHFHPLSFALGVNTYSSWIVLRLFVGNVGENALRLATLTTYKSQMSIYLFSHRLFIRHVYGHACHSIYVEDRNKFAGNSFSPYTVWVLEVEFKSLNLASSALIYWSGPMYTHWPYIHMYSQIKPQSTP